MRPLILLLISVFLLMFGYNAVEAAYPLHSYAQATKVLSVLYFVLTISSVLAGFLTSIKPAGSLIAFGPVGYTLFAYSLLLNDPSIELMSAVILGFTSAIYWICCNTIIYEEIEERRWGLAFGSINVVAVLAGGLGPFVLLRMPYDDLLKVSMGLCSLSILPLLPLHGRGISGKEGSLNIHLIKNILNKKLITYTITAFCFSVNLPIVIAYIPAICKNVGEYRLISYAIPSTLSLFGGALYDRFGLSLVPISAILALIAFLNLPRNPIVWGFILTASFSILSPGFKAFLGKIVDKDKIPIALGFVSLIAGMGVSLNIMVIGALIELAWLYLTVLMMVGITFSIVLLKLA